jgi:hypothetical protein
LAGLKEGVTVIFDSKYPNPDRRSLNGIECRIIDWVSNPSAGYPLNIAVCLQFTDDLRKTYAALDEFYFP